MNASRSTTYFAVASVSIMNGCDRVDLSSQDQQSIVNYTLAEVAKHASSSDCWIIIDQGIYNVTPYLTTEHPGGASAISRYCGANATTAFSGHSASAISAREKYYAGSINATADTPTPTPTPTATAAPLAYTAAQVALHAAVNDCWMIIDNKVYDFSNYFVTTAPANNTPVSHRGNSGTPNSDSNKNRRIAIATFCGKDVTNIYNGTVDPGGVSTHSHTASSAAATVLQNTLKGTLQL